MNRVLKKALQSMSQTEIARALDVTPQTVGKWVHGIARMPAEHAAYLAELIGEDPATAAWETLAENTHHQGRKSWLLGKATALSMVLFLGLGTAEASLNIQAIQAVNYSSIQYTLCAILARRLKQFWKRVIKMCVIAPQDAFLHLHTG